MVWLGQQCLPRYEIKQQLALPDDVLELYLEELKHRPHEDTKLANLGVLQYEYKYKDGAIKTVEETEDVKELSASVQNLNAKKAEAIMNANASASSSGATAVEPAIQVLACFDCAAVTNTIKMVGQDMKKLEAELASCRKILKDLKVMADANKTLAADLTSYTKQHQETEAFMFEVEDDLAVAKALSCDDADNTKIVLKKLRQKRGEILGALDGIKLARSKVKALMSEKK